ncbi:MAG: transposase [Chloroflexi bacterium]|nr:transposase [Chloroflexota bacterium]
MEIAQRSRKALRLPGYDYSQPGAYYVTVVTNQRQCLFGDVLCGEMRLNPCGQTVMECWDDLVHHYPCVRKDEFVVMPNHVHGILVLNDDVGAGFKPAPTDRRHGLPEIVRGFKTFSARRINVLRNNPGTPVWQRNYFEHVIRNEAELAGIREYIQNNPAQWETDAENPANM